MSIEERIRSFRDDLSNRDARDVVQRYLMFGDCYALNAGQYIDLKQSVATQFNINHAEVLVVGSAKLGFSIAPGRHYRHFAETSDIDVVLCSSNLFDAFWRDVFDYWTRGEVWPNLRSFQKYIFRGWMRPDMLPPEPSFVRSQEWWDFFRRLTASGAFGPYRVTGALYKDWHFLERYQAVCVEQCQLGAEGGVTA